MKSPEAFSCPLQRFCSRFINDKAQRGEKCLEKISFRGQGKVDVRGEQQLGGEKPLAASGQFPGAREGPQGSSPAIGRAICHHCHTPRGTAERSSQLLLSLTGLGGGNRINKQKEKIVKQLPSGRFGVAVGFHLELLMFALPLPAIGFPHDFFHPPGTLPITSASQWITSHLLSLRF